MKYVHFFTSRLNFQDPYASAKKIDHTPS